MTVSLFADARHTSVAYERQWAEPVDDLWFLESALDDLGVQVFWERDGVRVVLP